VPRSSRTTPAPCPDELQPATSWDEPMAIFPSTGRIPGRRQGPSQRPTKGEEAVVITIRPDPPNWFSVNLALSTAQAGRLLADLQNLLIPFGLLVGVLLAATVGCSAKVEVESAKWSATKGEKAKTAIHLDLLQSRSQEPSQKPVPPTIINVGSGDIHFMRHRNPATNRPSQGTPSTRRSAFRAPTPLAFLGYMAVCMLVGAADGNLAEKPTTGSFFPPCSLLSVRSFAPTSRDSVPLAPESSRRRVRCHGDHPA
jgi:hypothetical protein